MKFESSNPAMKAFEKTENLSLGPTDEFVANASQRMTANGTINKTGILLAIVVVTGAFGWNMTLNNPSLMTAFLFAAIIGGIGIAITLARKPQLSATLSPIYAVLEGLFLGGLTALFEQRYPGIAVQAVLATMATTLSMLIAYRTGIIRATPFFKKVVITAVMGIGIFYLISLGAYFIFGTTFSVNQTENATAMGIGLSVLFAGFAALSLILDFDLIERGVEEGAPKFMEWYGAFALTVTICWIYFEMIRLIAKLRD